LGMPPPQLEIVCDLRPELNTSKHSHASQVLYMPALQL
jgi:hypothetical protein